jgi:hypothetical protein
MWIKRIWLVLSCCFLLLDLWGCESIVHKFTRKSKNPSHAVEMVLAPEEYKPSANKEEVYRQYYLYWGTWYDELINALTQSASLKKKLDCAQEALKNMVSMKMMLVPQAQKNFDRDISRMNALLADMKSDAYGQNDSRNLRAAEKIKASVHLGFVYPKIRNYLKNDTGNN